MKADLVKVSLNYSSEIDPSPNCVHVPGKRSGGRVSKRMNDGVEVEVACDQRGCEGEWVILPSQASQSKKVKRPQSLKDCLGGETNHAVYLSRFEYVFASHFNYFNGHML